MGSDDDTRDRRASDVPLDLIKERDAFVRSFLKKGVEYTEQLLRENGELREELDQLRDDNTSLRAQVASDDAIRELLVTVEELRKERDRLVQRSQKLEDTEAEHAGRQAKIEQEINDLANLYVAGFQLHASLSPRRVVRHVCDMLGQLVGAEAFVLYLVDSSKTIVPLAHEGLEEAPSSIDEGVGPVGEAILTSLPIIRERDLHGGSIDDPVAVIPLTAEGRAVGAISVVRVLSQKNEWANVDHELFQLIGHQAAVAMIAANLYDTDKGPKDALAGLSEKLGS
ncbi:MAG: GAF domain-containing protein [Deltaproteobacteria bacterium]|nr:GAF domain-containing protein [Deltaproteobacteria bacterium]